jgi:hypothetical protein
MSKAPSQKFKIKTMRKLGIILTMVIMVLVSCKKDDETNPLVGTWVSTLTIYSVVYRDEITFNSNNTGRVLNLEDGIQVDDFSFTWSANNNILTVSYDGDTQTSAYSISGNKLTFGGEVYTKK